MKSPMKNTAHSRLLLPVILLLTLLLGACGFQLRGSHELAPELNRLNVAAPITMQRKLNRNLTAMGVQVAPKGTTIPEAFSLRITDTNADQRTISFDRNVSAAEIEYRREFSFELHSPDGTVVLGPVHIDLERVYVHDRDRLLGDADERAVLDRDMNEEAAQRIIHHLRRLSSQQIRDRIAASASANS